METLQRTILNPAFGQAQIRELAHIFVQKSVELRDVWTDEIVAQGGSARINILEGLKKMTLDVIGLAGFDYHLEALNSRGKPNELNEAFSQIFSSTPPLSIYRIVVSIAPFLDFFPDERARKVHEANVAMRRIGLQLIHDKKVAILRELGNKDGSIDKKDLPGRDLLTLLIKANMATDLPENQRLSDEEVLAHVQRKLREELLAVPTEFPTMDELAALTYLDWVVRETLRLHAPVTWTLRSAGVDDLIPVSEPYVDRYGRTRHEIQISAGNRVIMSILSVHHSKAIWGEDALEFKPERWEHPPETISEIPSVWGHMLTFSAGPHACIGYRLSLAELRALMFILVRAFEFELAVKPDDVTAVGMFTQRPAVRSEAAKGAQMPLIIRPYSAFFWMHPSRRFYGPIDDSHGMRPQYFALDSYISEVSLCRIYTNDSATAHQMESLAFFGKVLLGLDHRIHASSTAVFQSLSSPSLRSSIDRELSTGGFGGVGGSSPLSATFKRRLRNSGRAVPMNSATSF
ncbi:hypothetical protein ACG7TL_000896 [Trametes sanguinea]